MDKTKLLNWLELRRRQNFAATQSKKAKSSQTVLITKGAKTRAYKEVINYVMTH